MQEQSKNEAASKTSPRILLALSEEMVIIIETMAIRHSLPGAMMTRQDMIRQMIEENEEFRMTVEEARQQIVNSE